MKAKKKVINKRVNVDHLLEEYTKIFEQLDEATEQINIRLKKKDKVYLVSGKKDKVMTKQT